MVQYLHNSFHQIYSKKVLFISAILFISTFIISAQSPLQERYFMEVLQQTKNFEEIVQTVEKHYENKDKGKGSGYKQWKRWEEFYSTRLMPDGTVPNLGAVEWDAYKKSSLLSKKNTKSAQQSAIAGNWESIGPDNHIRYGQGYNGGIGRINCISVDPSDSNIIYVGTPAGGLWKSTTGGNAWTPLTDDLPSLGISGIAIDYQSPSTNRTIYILTGDGDGGHTQSIGVLKSIDNGVTWLSTGLSWDVEDRIVGYKLLMHPTNNQEMFVVTSSGIFKTTDGANSWNQVTQYQRIYDIEYKPGNPNYIYAAGAGFITRSTDGGDNWDELESDVLPTWGSRTAIAVSPDEPNYLYAIFSGLTGEGTMKGVFRSTDSGNSFSLRSNSPNILGYNRYGNDNKSQSYYDLAIAVSPDNADEVQVGGINCWKSTNGGSSWTNSSYWVETSAGAGSYTHADIHALEYYNGTLFSGSDGGIYKNDSSTNGWENISSGLVISQMYRIGLDPTNPNRFLHGCQDNGSNKIENGNYYHWYGADGFECIVDPSNPERIYGSYQNGGIIRSENNGLSITNIQPSEAGSGNWDTPYVLDPNDSDIIYAGYADLWKSEDRGDSWTNITEGETGYTTARQVAVAPSNSDYLYVLKSSKLYYSTNGGSSWEENEDIGYTTKTYISVHPTDPKKVWITAGGFTEGEKVFKSTDGGKTFTNISGSLPNIPTNCIVYENGSNNGIYIGTDLGIFYFNDDLSDWILFSNNLPTTIVKELEIQYTSGKLFAGTFGRGMWTSDLYEPSYKSAENITDISSGLSYSYYEGEWRILPDFSLLNPNEEGTVNNISLSPKNRDTNFGLEFNGYINIPQDGIYVFYLESDDGSKLYVGDIEVINNDRTHESQEKLGGIGLKKGYHSIRVSYFQFEDDSELGLSYSGPGISKQNIPDSVLVTAGNVDQPRNCTSSSNAEWISQTITEQSSNFSLSFKITPDTSNMDGVFGFSDTSATTYSELGIIVRFNTSGNIDVRNGSSYGSTNTVGYSPYTTYNFRIEVDFNNNQYDVYVSEENQSEILLADNFNFRSEKSALSKINSWSTFSNFGSISICDVDENGGTNELPEVSLTSPTNNSTYDNGDTITLSANASDTDGTITQVAWYANDQLLFTDYTAPYTQSWSNVVTGTYEIVARTEDNDGGITWSSPVTITVEEAVPSFCATSSANWSGTEIGSTEQGTFTATVEVTPNTSNMDGVVGLSINRPDDYSGLAAILRLNKNGLFDVRNGGSYDYSTALNYVVGTTYIVRFEIDVNSKKYDVYVAAPGASEINIASDYDFRTEQSTISSLRYWRWTSSIGNLEVCNPQILTAPLSLDKNPADISDYTISKDEIRATPNPASDVITFSLGKIKGTTNLTLISISGVTVLQETKQGIYDSMQMNIANLANGVYFAHVNINGIVTTKKVVIQH
ncbi:VPS10 domain-containing protein [Aquimarina pacifica]|uniref:VPS10 domain-containing protein n=1 Tax=Aquimarina pacifica TaxID=1296415 RepID=UPI000472ACD9|nr:PA14 domain-containing protein [Aquimarina pacifica]